MILLIDQGNTALKWCFQKNSQLTPINIGSLSDFAQFLSSETEFIEAIYLSCVKSEHQIEVIRNTLESIGVNGTLQIAISESENGRLRNGYQIPKQLGVDRWLAMLSIWNQLKSGFIVVDAGSALTLDIVDSTGQHLGGHIVPGLTLLRKSLLSDTDRITINQHQDATLFAMGKSTAEAVQNGCLTSLCSYIEKMYMQESKTATLPLFLTGGDAGIISKGVSIKHQLNSGLVLEGLLEYFKG